MESISNLLEGGDDGSDAILSQFLMDSVNMNKDELPSKPQMPFHCIKPDPGFCIKTKAENGEKVFVNVCQASNVPEPKDLSEEELIKILESEDPSESNYRIPMSLGDPHAEVDKGGKGCTAYDVIVSHKFFTKMQKSELFQSFFITICFEGIQQKFQTTLSKEWVILKNKKFMGTLIEQNVRKESKPLIMELDGTNSGGKSLISEIPENSPNLNSSQKKTQAPEPKFTILKEPAEGYPEFLVAEIHMPLVKTADSFMLDLGEDRILLQTRADVYHLDIYLPYNVIQEECGAQFHRKSKILTITMPVSPQS